MLPPRVHLVTERRTARDLVATVREVVSVAPPGSLAIQLREKDLGGSDLLLLARALIAPCRAAGQLLVVNDRVDVAIASGADGVHLPAAGVPPAEARRILGGSRLIGVSCHGVEDVKRARAAGADYASFSPIFDTPSKRAYGAPVGLEALRAAAVFGLPLVALGGVDAGNAGLAIEMGAHGVAAIRAWLAAPDPRRAVATLLAAVRAPR